jgi:hypothetical protein
MSETSSTGLERLPLTLEEMHVQVFHGNMVKLTINGSRTGRFPRRRRPSTNTQEFLLSPGEALLAAEILERRGAGAIAAELRSVAMTRINQQDPTDLTELIKSLNLPHIPFKGSRSAPRSDTSRRSEVVGRLLKRISRKSRQTAENGTVINGAFAEHTGRQLVQPLLSRLGSRTNTSLPITKVSIGRADLDTVSDEPPTPLS